MQCILRYKKMPAPMGRRRKREGGTMLCVEVDVEDPLRIGCGLIALNEYMNVSVGIHLDVLGRGLELFEVLGRAVFRLSEAFVQ